LTLSQESPNYGPRAKSDPWSHSIRPANAFHPAAQAFVNNEKQYIFVYLEVYLFILFNGKRRQTRAWSAICQLRQHDSKKSTYKERDALKKQ